LMRLDGAIDRLKATIAMEIKKGGWTSRHHQHTYL
jgi:hypothetical protein